MELKNETRESFIFHAEYIADVPEELQPQYAMYAINYALKGIEPELEDWRDIKMWNAIKSRIDGEAEQYEATIKARAAAGRSHKGNQYTRKNQEEPNNNDLEQNGTKWNKMEQMELYLYLIMNLLMNMRMRLNLMQKTRHRAKLPPLFIIQTGFIKFFTTPVCHARETTAFLFFNAISKTRWRTFTKRQVLNICIQTTS